MTILNFVFKPVAATVAVALLAGAASAAQVTISITNEQDADGVFLTPLLSIFHDGSYDTFSPGGSATAGLELIAEDGDPSLAINEANAGGSAGIATGVITSPGGFAGAPVIDPGETASLTFDLDTTANRYFSYLSMVIPSNDTFIGNDNPTAYEIFDAAGLFNDFGTIEIYTNEAWDAGTEANDNLGAAFNAAGGTATDTTDPIAPAGSLLFLSGEATAAGTTVNLSGERQLLATINVSPVPVPAALPLLLAALGGLGLMRRRRING